MIKINVQSIIDEYEPKRASAHKTYLICLIIGILLLVVAVPLIFIFSSWALILAGVLGVAGIILIAVSSSAKNRFTKNFLNDLSRRIFNQVFPDNKYSPALGMDIKEILFPGFFMSPDRWNTNDLMEASYNGIPFRMGYYNLQNRQRHTDSKGNVYYSYVTYAEGRMIRFRFSKNFKATVKVMEKSFGDIFNEPGLEKCETEYIDFNKRFALFTNDQLTTFYILTPQIQEKMMELEETFHGQLYMAFINNELYVAMNTEGGNIYKFKFGKPLDAEGLKLIISAIIVPATFIDLLDIDDRKFSSDSLSL